MIGTDGAWWSISGNHYRRTGLVRGRWGSRGVAYLSPNVVKGRRANNGEADEEDIGLGVRERAKTVVILLASGIPQTQADRLAVDHDAGRVVVEPVIVSGAPTHYAHNLHGGDVFAREGIGGVGYEETGLR